MMENSDIGYCLDQNISLNDIIKHLKDNKIDVFQKLKQIVGNSAYGGSSSIYGFCLLFKCNCKIFIVNAVNCKYIITNDSYNSDYYIINNEWPTIYLGFENSNHYIYIEKVEEQITIYRSN